MQVRVLEGHVLERLAELPDESVQMCVTSPPYWSQRLYGCPPQTWPDGWCGELGQEPTAELFITHTVQVFEAVRRVLRKDGCMFLNIGDTRPGGARGTNRKDNGDLTFRGDFPGCNLIAEKSMALIPERLLIALADAGWIVRSKIVWEKPSAMPESAKDRPTDSWEPIYFLTKSPRYASFFDQVREACAESTLIRTAQNVELQEGSDRANGGAKTNGKMKSVGGLRLPDAYKGLLPGRKDGPGQDRRSKKDRTRERTENRASASQKMGRGAGWRDDPANLVATRNIRNVWRFSNPGTTFQHYATFPPELPKRCILAGSKEGDVVLDPFSGSGTTLAVAIELGRQAIGIEAKAEYVAMIHERLRGVNPPLPLEMGVG